MGDESELADIVSYMSHAMSMSQFVKEFGFGEDVFDFATGDQWQLNLEEDHRQRGVQSTLMHLGPTVKVFQCTKQRIQISWR